MSVTLLGTAWVILFFIGFIIVILADNIETKALEEHGIIRDTYTPTDLSKLFDGLTNKYGYKYLAGFIIKLMVYFIWLYFAWLIYGTDKYAIVVAVTAIFISMYINRIKINIQYTYLVQANLTGKISDIFIKMDDEVAIGDSLIEITDENDEKVIIKAKKSGWVIDIKCKVGDDVNIKIFKPLIVINTMKNAKSIYEKLNNK